MTTDERVDKLCEATAKLTDAVEALARADVDEHTITRLAGDAAVLLQEAWPPAASVPAPTPAAPSESEGWQAVAVSRGQERDRLQAEVDSLRLRLQQAEAMHAALLRPAAAALCKWSPTTLLTDNPPTFWVHKDEAEGAIAVAASLRSELGRVKEALRELVTHGRALATRQTIDGAWSAFGGALYRARSALGETGGSDDG